MVFRSTPCKHCCLPNRLWEDCRASNQRYSTISFLHVRDCDLVLFLCLPKSDIHYLCSKLGAFHQSLLSAADHSHRAVHQQHLAISHPIIDLPWLLPLFLAKGVPIHPSYRIIIIPFLVLQTALLGLGVGCLISALSTRFRDLQVAVAPMIQLWMYASCIFYPRSIVPENLQWLMTLNPIVPIIESFRFALMGRGQVEIYQWLAASPSHSCCWLWALLNSDAPKRRSLTPSRDRIPA